MTDQEKALRDVKKQFGNTAFTEHHVNYFRVGFRKAGKVVQALGDSWKEALVNLVVLDKTRKVW